MRSSKYVDQWLTDCDFSRNSLSSTMCFMYLSSRNVSEFLKKLLTNKKSSWNRISPMMNILSKSLIKKKEVLVERWLKYVRFGGIITLKKKPPRRLKIISIDVILVFPNPPQVPYTVPVHYQISGRDSF